MPPIRGENEAILGETSKDRQLGKKKVNEMSYFIVTIDSASITPDLHCASCVRRTSRVVHLFKFKFTLRKEIELFELVPISKM